MIGLISFFTFIIPSIEIAVVFVILKNRHQALVKSLLDGEVHSGTSISVDQVGVCI